MSIIHEIEEIYEEIDNLYDSKELEAITLGDTSNEKLYSTKRQHNNGAYFLFIFSRLEGTIKELYDVLISNNLKKLEEEVKNKKIREAFVKMPLKDKASLFLASDRNPFRLFCDYEEERNKVAHGGNLTDAIDMRKVIADMKILYADLKAPV